MKILRYLSLIIILEPFSACRQGFYSPPSMKLDVPDGPPTYKAGWYDGCRSGLSIKRHANSYIYDVTMGNGVYQHDDVYQAGWTNGWFSCVIGSGTSTSFHPLNGSPLE